MVVLTLDFSLYQKSEGCFVETFKLFTDSVLPFCTLYFHASVIAVKKGNQFNFLFVFPKNVIETINQA